MEAPRPDGEDASVDVGALWRPQAGPRRGPKPRYTLEGIADAAIAIADGEGLEAVSMQLVAARLGTTKMALYRYVTGRADLEAVMLDRTLGAPPAHVPADWQTALAGWARTLFARALEHPWAVELAQRPHLPGPEELGWYEAGLTATDGLPLSGGERLDLLVLLTGHALSLVRQSAASATPEEDLAAGVTAVLSRHGDRYPRTAAAFADSAREDSREDALDFGINRILAGVAALIADRA